MGYDGSSLEKICFLKEEYIVVCSQQFLKIHKIQTIKDLTKVSILSMDANGKWWDRFFKSISNKDLSIQIIEINHIRGIINAVLSLYGVALVPKYSVIDELRKKINTIISSN